MPGFRAASSPSASAAWVNKEEDVFMRCGRADSEIIWTASAEEWTSTMLLGCLAQDMGRQVSQQPKRQWWEGLEGCERGGQAQRNKGASVLYTERSEPSRLGCLYFLYWSFITLVLC